jgi:hypothetical protein
MCECNWHVRKGVSVPEASHALQCFQLFLLGIGTAILSSVPKEASRNACIRPCDCPHLHFAVVLAVDPCAERFLCRGLSQSHSTRVLP